MSPVSRHQPRARPATQDLDLIPPEEIRARRIRLFVFLGAMGICVLGVAIYFAAPSVGGAIKGWQSRRLARQAFALIDQRKWAEANAKARDALLLRSTEPESWRAIARLASRTGQSRPALEWWKKVDEAHRLTVEDRRDFVGAALTSGEVTLAAKQVEALLAQRAGPAPIDIVFAGFSRSRARIRSDTPARGSKLKLSRAIQTTQRRLTRSFFSHMNRRSHPCLQSAATHPFRSRSLCVVALAKTALPRLNQHLRCKERRSPVRRRQCNPQTRSLLISLPLRHPVQAERR